jgi:hypothetical protein
MIDTYLLHTAIQFINEIGIETESGNGGGENCFLPGLYIKAGRILVNPHQLKFPGDILHEAGHIAVVPAMERKTLNGPDLNQRADATAEEMMAIAWSYAACVHLDIDPSFVFHEHGYRGGAASIIEDFQGGRYVGVPVLQCLRMTSTTPGSLVIYPEMIKWLRD